MENLSNQIKPLSLPIRIKALRKAKGLTQKELAKEAGVSFSMVSKIESGERNNPSLETLEKIGSVIGLSLDDLLGDNSLHNKIIADDMMFISDFFKNATSEESNYLLDMIDSIYLLLQNYHSTSQSLQHLKFCSMYITMIHTLCTHLENVCIRDLLVSEQDAAKKLFTTYSKEKESINNILDSVFEIYLDKLSNNKPPQELENVLHEDAGAKGES